MPTRWKPSPRTKGIYAVIGFLSTIHWLITVGVGAIVTGLVWAFTSVPPGGLLAIGGSALLITGGFLHRREQGKPKAFTVAEIMDEFETIATEHNKILANDLKRQAVSEPEPEVRESAPPASRPTRVSLQALMDAGVELQQRINKSYFEQTPFGPIRPGTEAEVVAWENRVAAALAGRPRALARFRLDPPATGMGILTKLPLTNPLRTRIDNRLNALEKTMLDRD